MKQLTCEMCGSTNLLKQDGVFICQDCGTKYSVEEAKKMMVEGTVEVTGTVKVDNTSKLSNLYAIARRSRDDNNSEKAAQYYDMILQEDPMSWEASFYTTYYSAMQTNIAGIRSAAIKVNNCIDTVLKLIKDNVPEDQQLSAVTEVDLRVAMIAVMLYNAAESHYKDISFDIRSKYTQEYIDRLSAARDLMYNMGNQIEKIWGGDEKFGVIAASAWKDGVAKHKKFLGELLNKEANQKTIDSYSKKIGKYDPKYLEKHDEEAKKRDKAASESRIKGIDNEIENLQKSKGDKVSGRQKFTGVLSIIWGVYRLFNLFQYAQYLDEGQHLSPIAFVMPLLLIGCGAALWMPMKGPEPWRKGVGGVALAWSAYGLIMAFVRNGAYYLYATEAWAGNLILILCGVFLLRQKFDSKELEAKEKKLESLKKEKADLEKKLEELG